MEHERRKRLALLAFALAFSCAAANVVAIAYGDWLRHSSPRQPNFATGHDHFYKGAHATYYITSQQALYAEGFFFPLLMGFAVFGCAAVWLNDWEGAFKFTGGGWLGTLALILLAVAAATIAVALIAGDQMISLILTGASALPQT